MQYRRRIAKSDQFLKIGRVGLPSDATNKNGLCKCSGIPDDAWFQIWAQSVNFEVPSRQLKKGGEMVNFGSKKSTHITEYEQQTQI